MGERELPKVLLLCSFNQSTANGITVRNLFKGWPSERIGVIEFGGSIGQVFVNGVSEYYLLGDDEVRFSWPLSLMRRVGPTQSYSDDSRPEVDMRRAESSAIGVRRTIRNWGVGFRQWWLRKTGLSLVSRRYRVSRRLEAWIRRFQPDIVYYVGSDICKLDFVQDLKNRLSKPFAIHVFDDYVNTKHLDTWFPGFWKRRMDGAFRSVVGLADLHLAIGQKMAVEYSRTYGKEFFGFHNPIDPDIWMSRDGACRGAIGDGNSVEESKRSRYSHERIGRDVRRDETMNFRFVYAGKINQDTKEPILQFVDAITALEREGYCVEFRVYSPYPEQDVIRLLGKRAEDIFMGRVPYRDLPEVFRSADALLLPLGFSERTLRYIRLSMLTKVSEYMISNTPIFLFAPGGIAVSEYLVREDAAFHCSDPDRLQECLRLFLERAKERGRFAENAFRCAYEQHLMANVNARFRKLFRSLCSD